MKVNFSHLIAALALSPLSALALTASTDSAAPERQFLFIENNTDDNLFVTPLGTLAPRLTGSNKWTGMKYQGSGEALQTSLGYISPGITRNEPAGNRFDMWLDGLSVAYPLTGQRCITSISGCDINTGEVKADYVDQTGFYGALNTGGDKELHGLISPSFFDFMRQVPVGQNFTFTINTCMTTAVYDAKTGGRCRDQSEGSWYKRQVSHTKGAHLRLLNINAVSEVYINSNGVPVLGEGNSECKMQVIGARSGIACKMVQYQLNVSGVASNTSIHIYPYITLPGLTGYTSADVQFSLDGNSWKQLNGMSSYYTFNELKGRNQMYMFFSSNFFKKLVEAGFSDMGSHNLINIRFENTTTPDSGWYEFSTTNELIIKPREFGVSIIAEDFSKITHREGYVGSAEPPLEYNYIVTTSSKTAADLVEVKVTAPSKVINGRSYCLFTSADGTTTVPFPALLSITTDAGKNRSFNAGCDDKWNDMTDALWSPNPWQDINGETGVMNKTRLKFSIPLNDPLSLRSVTGQDWMGDVSTTGTITVKATWKNTK